MITIRGKNGICATVLAHSISLSGKEMITWEIEYPRLILAELNTHRMLSRNSFSSRAVPFLKMLDQLDGEPVRFGANQAGMQDKGGDFNELVVLLTDFPYDDNGVLSSKVPKKFLPKQAWTKAKELMIEVARAFSDAGYHKQVYNRLLEAWQMQKTVLSATETDNFFWLRDDDAADPTIRELARVMREAKDTSTPRRLRPGQWHLPYIALFDTADKDEFVYWILDKNNNVQVIELEDAIKVSCARCAAVSYRNEGYGVEKSRELYERLVGAEKKHASALEHCATPMKATGTDKVVTPDGTYYEERNYPCDTETWQEGITHMDRQSKLWSGNLQGWIQYRKLIPGECYTTSV